MFDDIIAAAAAKYGVPAALISAVIQHESGGNPDAVGDGGQALGLMQMHPAAAAQVGADWYALKDPAKAIPAGTAYLAIMLKSFGGDIAWALGAYNQGPGVMGKAKHYADAVKALLP